MKIDLSIDPKDLKTLAQMGEKKIAYGVINAINETAKQLQKTQRTELARRFKLRKKAFMLRMAAVIKPFASVKKGLPYAEIAVGQKPRLLLSEYERGFKRTPFTPRAKHVAVPITGGPARPTWAQSVPKELTFQRLRLKEDKKKGGKRKATDVTFTQTKRGQWKGRLRTFILKSTKKAPLGGVYQRVGSGPGDIRMVYSFSEPRWVKARLRFMQTVHKKAIRWFKANMETEVTKALIRARGGGRA